MATDGFIAASLIQSHRNIEEMTSSWDKCSDTVHNKKLTNQYEVLLRDYEALKISHEKLYQSCQEAFKQVSYAMLFINLGLLSSGRQPLTYTQIQSTLELDSSLSKLFTKLDEIGIKSKIGFISDSKKYWLNIHETFFMELKYFFETKENPNAMFPDISIEDIISGVYGEMSGHLYFNNLRINNEALAKINLRLNAQTSNLKQEIDSLKEENAILRNRLLEIQNQ